MKHFFDTEFIEHAGGIQLVSIGIYSENGNTLYIESSSFDPSLADDWVKENVLAKLIYGGTDNVVENSKPSGMLNIKGVSPEDNIKKHIITFLEKDSSPEFYAYFASYDWVVFARLFGRMIDLPKNFPMWVIDLKQMMWERGLTKEWKQQMCPDPEGEHNALVDAEWNYTLYKSILIHERDSSMLNEIEINKIKRQ